MTGKLTDGARADEIAGPRAGHERRADRVLDRGRGFFRAAMKLCIRLGRIVARLTGALPVRAANEHLDALGDRALRMTGLKLVVPG